MMKFTHVITSLVLSFSLISSSAAQEVLPSQISAQRENRQTIPLSMNSAILYALADNPNVNMSLARQKQASASITKARAQFFPVIDVVGEIGQEYNDPAANVIDGGSTNSSNSMSITLKQMVYDWNKTRANYDQQKQLKKSSELDTQANIEEIMNNTINSYLAILSFQKNLKEQTAFVESIRKLTQTIETMFEAGASSKAMRDYARSRLAAAENENATIRANLNDAISDLEFLTGPLPPFEASNPDDLDPARFDLSSFIARAEELNTGIQLSQSDLQALSYRLEHAKKSLYPTISLAANAEQKYDDGGRTGRDREAQIFLQINHRLYDGGEKKADVTLTRAQIEEGKANQELILKELKRIVKQSYNQITSTQETRLQTLKEIEASEALQKLNRQNFEQGTINVIELIEGEERLNNARNRLNALTSDLYLNTYRLLITSGYIEQAFFCGTCSYLTTTQYR